MSCYNYEEKHFAKGLFDDCIDATYIIHLENNGRLTSILKQLKTFHPSKIVNIVFNKGYKNCKKDLKKQTPPYDLIHAFLEVFKDANKKKYNNILILEDDFIFNKKIKNKKIIEDISSFINEKKNEEFMYMLGALPFAQIPYEKKHFKLLSSIGTHACIYSKKLIDNVLNNKYKMTHDWDNFTNINFKRYIYDEPLCYQLFPETDNSKHWDPNMWMLKLNMKLVGLQTKPEFGYWYYYFLSKYLFSMLLLVLILVILFIFYYYSKN